jgi:molybdopterin-binding protein
VELTPGSVDSLGLRVGVPAFLVFKTSSLVVNPSGRAAG